MLKYWHQAESPNIILITIDCLRADHLGCYGYQRNTSPNIDSLAAGGVRFLEAISSGGNTSAAFPSILASALPPLQESEIKALLRSSITLAEILKNTGYRTAAFHSNPYLLRFYGYDRGFDTFEDNMDEFVSGLGGIRRWLRAKLQLKSPIGRFAKFLSRSSKLLLNPVIFGTGTALAEDINNQVMSWLRACPGKFFLWVHYMDVHEPYIAPQQHIGRFHNRPIKQFELRTLFNKLHRKQAELSSAEVAMLIDLYDAEINYTDGCVGVLLDTLLSDLPNTVIIVTADHGDAFGEHGKFGHSALYEELIRIPLIIAGPVIEASTVIKEQVSLVDLAPTIAEIAGIEGVQRFHGHSLFPLMRGEAKAGEGTISVCTNINIGRFDQRIIAYRTPSWKYICTENVDTGFVLGEEVYWLANDPNETKNLHGADNKEANSFEMEAKHKVARFKQLKAEEAISYEKQRVKARLSKLGKL